MKKIFTHGFTATILATMISFTSTAQSDLVASASPSLKTTNPAAVARVAGPAVSVNTRIARAFYKNFRAVQDVQWKESKSEYIARFMAGDRFAMAWFSKAGDLHSASFYGTARHLPNSEMELIRNNFSGYEITATTEILVQNSTAWIVTLQGMDQVKKVKLAEGGYEVMETMRSVK